MSADVTVQLLGIRHHGPGSARSVLRALTDQMALGLEAKSVVVLEPRDGS